MLDPAPASSLPSDIVRRVTWLTPNETEAATLVGEHGSPEEVADALTGQGATNIVLKLGKRGCLVAQAGAPKLSVPGFDVEAVDTTAAGDGFNAAFAVALMRGRNTLLAATYANAVAALSVTKAGAQPSMPAHDDVINFLEKADRQAA
jgi:ribokinase